MGRGRRVGAGQPGLIAASAGAVPSRHLRPSPRGSWARALSFLQVFVAPVYFPVNEVGRRLRAGCCPWRRRSSEGISSPRLQPAPPPLSRPPPPQAACGSHLPSVRRQRPHSAHPGPRPRPRPRPASLLYSVLEKIFSFPGNFYISSATPPALINKSSKAFE